MNEIVFPLRLWIGSDRYDVNSFEEASKTFTDLRDAKDWGSRATPHVIIEDSTGAIVAHVSYNGRVWGGNAHSWAPGTAPLYDPLVNRGGKS